ncbi:MAG: hypothetical protein PWQ59_2214 [Thermoanaerobacterium sp.]|nr:hypothetical protein [Thermoanaerobacterium sp.]
MLKSYRILLKDASKDSFEGDLEIGSILVPAGENEKEQALQLIPDLKNLDWEIEEDKTITNEPMDLGVYNEEFYINVVQKIDDINFEPIDLVMYALFDSTHKLFNNVDYKQEDFKNILEMKKYILEEVKVVAIKDIFLIGNGIVKLTDKHEINSKPVGFMYITEKDMENNDLSKEDCENILEKEFKYYKAFVEKEVFLVETYDLKKIYRDEIEPLETRIYYGFENIEKLLNGTIKDYNYLRNKRR